MPGGKGVWGFKCGRVDKDIGGVGGKNLEGTRTSLQKLTEYLTSCKLLNRKEVLN